MAKRIIGKLHPERYIVQDNMLFGCIPFIYVARKVFNTAYKSTEEIVELIKPTVDVIDVIKPIYNFKAKL